jgi:hypothetical protein
MFTCKRHGVPEQGIQVLIDLSEALWVVMSEVGEADPQFEGFRSCKGMVDDRLGGPSR